MLKNFGAGSFGQVLTNGVGVFVCVCCICIFVLHSWAKLAQQIDPGAPLKVHIHFYRDMW